MELSLSRLRNLVLTVRELPARGLWPYTPDPAAPGLHVLGNPATDAPLLIEGNSRHALGRLRRAFGRAGCRVLLLDTGGLDLYTAHAAGLLTLECVLAAWPSVASGEQDVFLNPALLAEDDGSDLDPLLHVHALLPYPLWRALGAEQLAEAGVQPGPGNIEDLPACLLGAPLTPAMQRCTPPARERLRAAAAHGGLFLLVAFLPLMVIGWRAVILAAGLVLVTLPATVFLAPYLTRKMGAPLPQRLPVLVVALALGLVILGGGLAAGLGTTQTLLSSGSVVFVSGWLGLSTNVSRPNPSHEPLECS